MKIWRLVIGNWQLVISANIYTSIQNLKENKHTFAPTYAHNS
jgi:hypothetical protein